MREMSLHSTSTAQDWGPCPFWSLLTCEHMGDNQSVANQMLYLMRRLIKYCWGIGRGLCRVGECSGKAACYWDTPAAAGLALKH